MIRAMLDKLVVAEDQLLLPLVALSAEVAGVASRHENSASSTSLATQELCSGLFELILSPLAKANEKERLKWRAQAAGDHGPLALLHHEVHELHSPQTHVVLALSASALKGVGAELQVAVVRVILDLTRAPGSLEEGRQLLKDPILILSVDLDVPDLPQLDHDQGRDHVQRVGCFELQLLLSNLALPPGHHASLDVCSHRDTRDSPNRRPEASNHTLGS